jgi:uncharacterized protein Usg
MYKYWLSESISQARKQLKPSNRFVFINAWNEWAEGAHLEPDQEYGYAYLNATNIVIRSSLPITNKLKIGVLIHAYYLDVLPELLSFVKNINEKYTILISVCNGDKEKATEILKNFNQENYILKEVENIGYDIAPMFCAFREEIFEFDIICKIHTKKSTHNTLEFGNEWRRHNLYHMLKNKTNTEKIIKEFNLDENLGIVFPPGFQPILDWMNKEGRSLIQIENFLPQILIPESYENWIWPVGSFFWFRPKALKLLFDQNFSLNDFSPKDFSQYDDELNARDRTLAHSVERVFCYSAKLSGYVTLQTTDIIFDDLFKTSKFPFDLDETDFKYKKEGFCPICNLNSIFFSNHDWLRDNYRCIKCYSLPRDRAIFNVLNMIDHDWRKKRIHESSPSNKNFSNVVKDYTCSQYFPDEVPGEIINGYRNENLEKLTFSNQEFDYFISLDVMEHVFNPGVAIQEMLRTIKKDGAVVFTVPIHKHVPISIQRAELLKDNSIKYILPEDYHGNAIGNGKCLVTWDYGQDFKKLVQIWIGENYEINIYNETNDEYGIIGEYLDVVVIRKINRLL